LIVIALLLFALSGASGTTTRDPCLRYGPDSVRITGTLARHQFYGPPGFGESPKRDAKEVGFYLDLASPLCTNGSVDNERKTGVRRVQLILDAEGYDRLRPALGKTITLRGMLFAAMSGHHHAPVLLRVISE
jgi:hypothetical protein